ncbi:hypothetical protein HDU78_002155 [Chytriomyces hyalinus]|nr:hypothetical protein HDU78_002155 [Chytriomyces hyalinus]
MHNHATKTLDDFLVANASRTRVQLAAICAASLLIAGTSSTLNILGGAQIYGTESVFVQTICVHVFSVVGGLVAGPLSNLLGPRKIVLFAAVSYAFMMGSQLHLTIADDASTTDTAAARFSIFANSLGALARALLYTCVGQAVLAYPSESKKGTALAALAGAYGLSQWAAYGVATGLSWSSDALASPKRYVYTIMILVALFGGFAAGTVLLVPSRLVRKSCVRICGATPSVGKEMLQYGQLLRMKQVWLFAGTTFIFAYYNGTSTSIQPASDHYGKTYYLTWLVYNVAYVLAVAVISVGHMDNMSYSRPMRARMVSAAMSILMMIVLLFTFCKLFTLYGAYTIYAFFDAGSHVYYLWLMGTLTNSPYKQAQLVGFLYAVYSFVQGVKFTVVQIVPKAAEQDANVAIGLPIAVLFLYGIYNSYFVADTCEDGQEGVGVGEEGGLTMDVESVGVKGDSDSGVTGSVINEKTRSLEEGVTVKEGSVGGSEEYVDAKSSLSLSVENESRVLSKESRANAHTKIKSAAVTGKQTAVAAASLTYKTYVQSEAAIDRALVRSVAATGVQLVAACVLYLVIAGTSDVLNGIGGLNLFSTDPVFVQTMTNLIVAMVAGLASGLIVNCAGPRIAVILAAVSYVFYTCSQLFLRQNNLGTQITDIGSTWVRFAIFSSAFAAFGRVILLSAVGAIVLAYPKEHRKGSALSIAAAITGVASIAAPAVNLALSWNTDSLDLDPPKYAYLSCILIIVFLGGFGSMFLLKPVDKVRRSGEVLVRRKTTVRVELAELKNVLKSKHVWMLNTAIMFMSYYNGSTKNLLPASVSPSTANSPRSMSLLNLIYAATYIVGVAIVGATLLDNTKHPRSRRARMTSAIMVIMWMCVMVVTYLEAVTAYVSYAMYGAFDGFSHAFFVWLLGCLSNSVYKQARVVGVLAFAYTAVQMVRYWLWWALHKFIPASAKVDSYDRIAMSVFVVFALVMLGVANHGFVRDTTDDDDDNDEENQGENPAEFYMDENVPKQRDVEAEAGVDEITAASTVAKQRERAVKFADDSNSDEASLSTGSPSSSLISERV